MIASDEADRSQRLIDSVRFPKRIDGRFMHMPPGTGLRILHVTNVAQNAYINASILTARGHDCDVFAPDYYHAASAPEWYELFNTDIDIDLLGGDPNFPDFYTLGRGLPRIADWVAHGPFYVALHYLTLRRRRDPLAHTALSVLAYHRFKATMQRSALTFASPWSDAEFECHLRRYDLNPYLKRRIIVGRTSERVFEWVRKSLAKQMPEHETRNLFPPWTIGSLDNYFEKDRALEAFVRGLRARGLSQVVGLEFPGDLGCMPHVAAEGFEASEVIDWTWFGKVWRELASHYDVCIFYGESSRFALCAGIKNYCTLEHGTIRTMPFEPTVRARLLKKSYESADRVFLTNTDYATAKPRLKFAPDQAVYSIHPFDEDPAFRLRAIHLRKRDPANVTFLCLARQDWVSGDPTMAKGNDRYFKAARLLLDRLRSNFTLICVDHGVDRGASRQLIENLGLQNQVRWIPVLTKHKLWAAMLDACAIIDQFTVSAFGGVAFEAFALGCRLISRDDGVNNGAFFKEQPPILAASTQEEIAEQMMRIMDDPDDTAGLGRRGIAWVEKYHSAERGYQLQLEAFANLAPCDIIPEQIVRAA